jgi:type IV pilus assembly protein PilE
MKMKTSTRKSTVFGLGRYSGMTLTELLIVLAIVAMLTIVSYPSFMQSVRKSNRTDAQTALTRASAGLERFFAVNSTYTTDTSQLGLKIEGGAAYTDNGHYVVTVAAGATGIGSSYKITAKAKAGDMQVKDTGCVTLTLDSVGRRTPDPADSRCW